MEIFKRRRDKKFVQKIKEIYMKYQKFNISESNLEKGMIVEGKVKQIKPYGAFIELENRYKWTFIYRRYMCIKNKIAI